MRKLVFVSLCVLIACSPTTEDKENKNKQAGTRWTVEEAWAWYDQYPWMAGTNFNPSTSINQLEFWQEDSFDPETINRELSWSADIGMKFHRVYLHNLLWDQDSTGFIKRLEAYLLIADQYDIKTMFVLLDDVWHPVPELGQQPDPVPHVHNSGWVQAPGAAILGDSSRHDELEAYVKGVLRHFSDDQRVICWDLYNEPDNVAGGDRAQWEVKDKYIYSLALLKKVFKWAREVDPKQPLTVGFWKGEVDHWGDPDNLPAIDRFVANHSDVISFHAYDGDEAVVRNKIEVLKTYGRPLLCTEYLAREHGNTFEKLMPLFKEEKIAAINWGLVSGKTNTIYPWKSWRETYTAPPEKWHHDVFHADGRPFSESEIELIKSLTQMEPAP